MEYLLGHYHIFWFLGTFLMSGVLLAFTPCVLPMVPILSSIIIRGSQEHSKKTAFFLSLAYVIGISVAYAILGWIISTMGLSIQSLLHNTYVLLIFGCIFVLLACSLFGFFEIKLPLSHRLLHISHQFAGKGYISVFIMGFFSALIVSPCVTPPLVGALTYIATTGNQWMGAIALFCLGFGMGLPLMIICVVGQKYLPKTGKWMETVKFILGFLLLAVAVMLWQRAVSTNIAMMLWGIYMIVVAVTVVCMVPSKMIKWACACVFVFILGSGIFLVYTKSANMMPYTTVKNIQGLDQLLEKAKTQHQPVLLDFYADWCLDCQSMEVSVFQKKAVRQALTRFMWIKVDLTDNMPEAWAIEERYQIVGPPTFIFYSAEGKQVLMWVGMKSAADILTGIKQI